jgi:hypothetical protein
MDDAKKPSNDSSASDFAREAEQKDVGFFSELFGFLKHNKKWWLIPVIVVLLLVGVLGVLGSSAIAPFIYTLF